MRQLAIVAVAVLLIQSCASEGAPPPGGPAPAAKRSPEQPQQVQPAEAGIATATDPQPSTTVAPAQSTTDRPLSSSVQCSGTTKNGKRCRNKTLDPSGRCHLHR